MIKVLFFHLEGFIKSLIVATITYLMVLSYSGLVQRIAVICFFLVILEFIDYLFNFIFDRYYEN